MPAITFTAKIASFLSKMDQELPSPDAKHNVGRMLGIAFMWDSIASYAKKQSDIWWAKLEEDRFIETAKLGEGDHDLCESPHFKATAKVTKPYKVFNPEKMTELLKPFKVPAPKVRELIEKAKVETKPRVTLKIEERGN